jgi:hypothetical protein
MNRIVTYLAGGFMGWLIAHETHHPFVPDEFSDEFVFSILISELPEATRQGDAVLQGLVIPIQPVQPARK